MVKRKNDIQITKKDLTELQNNLEKHFDAKIDNKLGHFSAKIDTRLDQFDSKIDTKLEQFDAKIDHKLGRFAEEIILPAIENIVKTEISDAIGQHRNEMKNYIDEKLSEQKGDIIAYMKGDEARDKNWKLKVVNILKREKIAKPAELEFLANLIK
jgi:hypothetical protein